MPRLGRDLFRPRLDPNLLVIVFKCCHIPVLRSVLVHCSPFCSSGFFRPKMSPISRNLLHYCIPKSGTSETSTGCVVFLLLWMLIKRDPLYQLTSFARFGRMHNCECNFKSRVKNASRVRMTSLPTVTYLSIPTYVS